MPHSRFEGGAHWRWALLALALLGVHTLTQAHELVRASSVKAAYLHKFGSFVDWPAGTFQGPRESFVIGVYGDDAVAAALEQLARAHAVEGRPITVLRLRDAAGASPLHILYAGGPRESRIREVLNTVRGPVLTVADGHVGGDPGPVLHFTEERGRVRFHASTTAAEARNLRLSAKLLAVAQQVERR